MEEKSKIMREYTGQKEKKIIAVQCNCCGKKLRVENGVILEGVYGSEYNWEYFSKKDGETHAFDLCEACYDAWIQQFILPIQKKERNCLI